MKYRGIGIICGALVLLLATNRLVHAQMGSSSRPLSSTVVATYVTHAGELALLVLWRGSPGWWGGRSHRGSGGGGVRAGQEFGSVFETYGDRTISIELNFTARTATLAGQNISLADTNVVLVDDIDAAAGPRIVGRQRIDASLPQVDRDRMTIDDDPAIIAIRRAAAADYLQCDIPIPAPAGLDSGSSDAATAARLLDALQGMMASTCNQAR